ncbi:unnamed protein product, partial [Staurois parvus]
CLLSILHLCINLSGVTSCCVTSCLCHFLSREHFPPLSHFRSASRRSCPEIPITVIPPYSSPVHTHHCHTSVLLSCTYPSLSYLRTPLLYIPITVIPPYSSPVSTDHCHTSVTPLLYIPITVIPPYSSPVHTNHCHTPVLLSCTY